MADSVTSLLGAAPSPGAAGAAGAAAPTVKKAPAITTPPVTPTQQQAAPAVTSLLGNKNDPMKKPVDSYGLDFGSQRDFLAASSDEERTLVLEAGKKAGKWQAYGNAPIIPGKPDAGLEWFVIMNDGKKVAVVDPFASPKTAAAAFFSHPLENMAMALSALIPEFGWGRAASGAVKTGALEGKGAMDIAKHVLARIGKGAAYAIVRSTFTAAATALGAAADDATKAIRGLWAGSTEEEMARLLHEASVGFGTEFISRTLSGIVSAPRAGYSPLLPPEHKATVKSTIDRGMVPGVQQATAGKSIIGGWEQSLIETILGGPLQKKRNLEAMKTEAKKQLMATGMNASQAEVMLNQVMASVRSRIDRSGVNQDLRNRANTIIDGLQTTVDKRKAIVESDLNARMANLERTLGSPDPATQDLAQQELVKARREFGDQATALYDKVDAVIAGSARPIVVDWGAVKKKAREVWSELPRDQFGNPVFKEKPELGGALQQIMNMPEFTDFKTAQKARKALYDAGEYKNLTPGRNSVLFNQLGDTIDHAFATADFSGAQADAVKALKDADAFWRENIDRFQGLRVRQLMSDATRADPETIAGIIFKRGFVPEAANFKANMTPAGWANVGAAYFSLMTKEATDAFGKLDPVRFLGRVQREMDLLKVAFGDRKAADMLKFAQDNAAFHGKLDAASLTPGNFRDALTRWQGADVALQEKLKSNYVHMLMDRSPEQHDAIQYMLADPGRIADAKTFYGETSAEWTAIKSHAMAEILARGLTQSGDFTMSLFEAGGLSKALAAFSDKQLVELFGKDHAADLKQLAKDIDLVQARPGHRMTGALAAAAYMLHPLGHIAAIVQLAITGQLMASPWFVRWLATGFEEKTQRQIAHWVQMGKMIAFFTVPGLHQLFNLAPQPDAVTQQSPMRQAAHWTMGQF